VTLPRDLLNDTDMCEITAACLSFNLYHSLVTYAPAFRKPRLIRRLLRPTFVH
jgi:hypothetical protein